MTTFAFDPTVPAQLEGWLVERLAEYLPDLSEAVDPHRDLGEYGLDSIAVVAFAADVEERLGTAVDPGAIWDHPTIARLAEHLASELAAAAGADERPQAA
ncbi:MULTISPECIES: acyl carrier protein [Streptomyces]|uniref:Peptide carrier protein n=2 Tax=Streptomyces TaxID=1883 RepID=A0A2U9P651_STRAS|nr:MULTISPECIES: acyl carrier protein [Streptomyces]AWT45259.1 peptide carrier protein [Streptomyces actuosus]MBM4821854.1 acyl carrier protein [Streptomyces actuosus]GHF63996.1 phosphopantetheine-binding protein [Streptomyces griseosporeus]